MRPARSGREAAHEHQPGVLDSTAPEQQRNVTSWATGSRGSLPAPAATTPYLAERLSEQQPRWWLGPVQVPLDQLNRLAGPPGDPVLRAVDDDYWRDDVDDLAQRIEGGLEPAPVIVTYRDDQLMLEDGNHRVEALRRAGVDQAWAVIGFEDPEQRDRFAP